MHIFITGPKRVGKSTLLNKILAAWPGSIGGFRTVRLDSFLPGQYTVHLLRPGESQAPQEGNLLFVCGQRGQDIAARFEALGCLALAESAGADLLLMDELGPHELEAAGFQRAVWQAVEGETPILGVLQQADAPFLDSLARHPRVQLVHVSLENRDDLARNIPEYIQKLRE